MDAQRAFTQFVQRCLSSQKARRLIELSATQKGQQKILASLYHKFEVAVRSDAVRSGDYKTPWDRSCFAFHERLGILAESQRVSRRCFTFPIAEIPRLIPTMLCGSNYG